MIITLPYLGALWLALMITPLDLAHNLATTQHRIVYALRLASFVSLFLISERLLLKSAHKNTHKIKFTGH